MAKEFLSLDGLKKYDAKIKAYADAAAEAAQSAASYDDTALAGRVTTVEGAIETLNGTGAGSVSKTVTDAIATVVAEAPEKFDTLKEIADWIENDTTGAAKMASDISTNGSDITTIAGTISATKGDISALKTTEKGTLVGAINEVKDAVDAITGGDGLGDLAYVDSIKDANVAADADIAMSKIAGLTTLNTTVTKLTETIGTTTALGTGAQATVATVAIGAEGENTGAVVTSSQVKTYVDNATSEITEAEINALFTKATE